MSYGQLTTLKLHLYSKKMLPSHRPSARAIKRSKSPYWYTWRSLKILKIAKNTLYWWDFFCWMSGVWESSSVLWEPEDPQKLKLFRCLLWKLTSELQTWEYSKVKDSSLPDLVLRKAKKYEEENRGRGESRSGVDVRVMRLLSVDLSKCGMRQ